MNRFSNSQVSQVLMTNNKNTSMQYNYPYQVDLAIVLMMKKTSELRCKNK